MIDGQLCRKGYFLAFPAFFKGEHNLNKNKQILVLTHKEDGTADLVIKKILDKGGNCIRFNTEDYPEKVTLTMQLSGHRLNGHLVFEDSALSLEDIGVVWYRRPHKPSVAVLSDIVARNWAEEESHYALKCLWTLLENRFWVNPILSCEKIQFNKWHQMIIASKLGFHTPASLLSNCHDDAIKFCKSINGDLAIKVIKNVAVRYDKKTLLMHTRRIKPEQFELASSSTIKCSPVFLQKYIEKKLELRITVVENKIFACEIHSQEDKRTSEDWRKHIFLKKELPHIACKLPRNIEKKCISLIKDLGLYFGAIDMILTPDNKYVFLEVNPNGQWGWIEELTGMPISSGVADLLMSR